MVPGRGRSRKILTFIKQFRVLAIHERQFKGSSFCRKKICFRDGLKVSKVLSGNFFTQLSQLFPDRIFCDQFPRIVLDYFPCSRELFIYFLACIYLKLKFSSQDKCRVFFSIYFGLGSIPSRRLAVSEHHFSYCVFFPLPFLLGFILMYAA